MDRTDPAAADTIDRWVDAHADGLFRYALTRLRRREDAEDAVQEALLAAVQARQTFRGDSSERTWLIAILRNKIIDRIRILARECPAGMQDADEDSWWQADGHWAQPAGSWDAQPDALVEKGEFWEQVRRCFGALPERQAQLFSLRTFDGIEAEEICKQTGITPTNLWVQLHRARTRLRACLEATWFAKKEEP